jgi:hypothetical protein
LCTVAQILLVSPICRRSGALDEQQAAVQRRAPQPKGCGVLA